MSEKTLPPLPPTQLCRVCQEPVGNCPSENSQGCLQTLRLKLIRRITDLETDVERLSKPLELRLCCEHCGELHIDEGEFEHKVHHTHSCQHCGATWRPAVEPTKGVRFLRGFKNP